MVYTLLSGPMVYTIFSCFPRKMVYTIAFFFSSVTSGSGDRPRKEGCHGGGVYSFFPNSFFQVFNSVFDFFWLFGPRGREGPGTLFETFYRGHLGSQHPSPNVKTLCNFETQLWLEIITSRDAQSACFKRSRTSCRETIFGLFWANFGQKRSHHVMDVSCWSFGPKGPNDPCKLSAISQVKDA